MAKAEQVTRAEQVDVDSKAEKPHNPAMNEAITFDTHLFVKRLVKTGFTEEQAEALLEEQVQFLNANLATKSDIVAINARFDVAEARTKADIAAAKAEIIKWVFGIVLTVVGLQTAAFALWPMFTGG